MKNEWDGIGVMSGTSLDGIDLAWCQFSKKSDGKWDYCIEKAVTVPYDYELKNQLENASFPLFSALDYVKLNNEVAEAIAKAINDWLGNSPRPDFIASHGHTIFHQPEIGLTSQIGNGAIIAAKTKTPTICDFRTTDVALGGQGAPLVPIGDELLFGEYDACLNLGGIANISYLVDNKRIAYDICPCNMALNPIAKRNDMEYDVDGKLAASGQVIPELLQELNKLGYYRQQNPKSLGKEWYQECFYFTLIKFLNRISDADMDCTVVEHITEQIAANVPEHARSMLVTGGGAHNKYLIDCLRSKRKELEVIVPNDLIVDYKEALIFAFLGLLRLNGENNCISSVTGASKDSCGGAIYL